MKPRRSRPIAKKLKAEKKVELCNEGGIAESEAENDDEEESNSSPTFVPETYEPDIDEE